MSRCAGRRSAPSRTGTITDRWTARSATLTKIRLLATTHQARYVSARMSEATVGDASAAIEHVSDTARWVALYRAMESERPDALFHDPYARRLAGERGEQILSAMPKGRTWAWPMIVRTAVMDELIMRTISRDGADAVINLAAGLDTRPYRLPP